MSDIDNSKSFERYKATVRDLKDELNLLEDDLNSTPPPSLRSLQFSESELTKTYEAFLALWSSSQNAIDTSELEQSYRDHHALKRSAWSLLSQIKSAIDANLADAASKGQPHVPVNPIPNPIAIPVKHLPHPSMPQIPIPEFNGELKKWKNFWDSFSSLIDSRQDIDPVIKFNLLRNYLKDKAYRVVEGLSVTNDNYSVALKLLKSRFADDKYLLQKLHLELMNMKQPGHNYHDLNDFSLTFKRLLYEIEALNKVQCDDYLYKDIIAKKLSPETLAFLFNKFDTHDLTLDQLTRGIDGIVENMERSREVSDQSVRPKNKEPMSTSSTSNKTNSHQSTNPSQNKFSSVSKQAVVSSQSQSQSNNQKPSSSTTSKWNRPCLFCTEVHNSKFCANYPTHESRKNRIRDLGVCFICMKKGHKASDCTITPECRHCSGRHHTFLCMKLTNKSSTAINQVTVSTNPSTVVTNSVTNHSSGSPTNPVSVDDDSSGTVSVSNNSVVNSIQTDVDNQTDSLSSVALATVMTTVSGAGVRESVRTFLDVGAQRSFIHTALAQRLKLKPLFRITLKMIVFNNQVQTIWCDVVRVVVRIGTQRITILAVVYDEVNSVFHVPGIAKVSETLKNKGIKLGDPNIDSDKITGIGLVIGADYYTRIVTSHSYLCGVNLLSTPAGSVIVGLIPKWAISTQSVNVVHVQDVFCARVGVQCVDSDLSQVSNLWNLDVVGIKPETLTPEETQTVNHFESTCQKVDNQYFVELPFKNDERPPTNYRKSYGQLMSLSKSFASRPELFGQYSKIFNEYIELGFIEKVDNPSVVDGLSHYLPHHPVYKTSPTTPIRIVFNASSRANANAKSLNDCLLTGPTLTSKLVDSIVEFRTNPIAVVADISKAFLRIGILHKDRDFCRFLFFEDENLQKIITYRFCVVMFGATSSPFLLQKTLTHHLETHSHPLAKSLISHFYADNFSCTYSDVDQLKAQYPCINSILSEASMPLQGWVSNDVTFNDEIDVDHEQLDLYDVNVLGISWNTN